jgi:adenosylcobinamide-GDP ribazoletransferase
MKRSLHALQIAFQFLTRIPAGDPPWSEDMPGRAAVFFPLVGLVVGAGGALIDWICCHYSVDRSLRAIAVLAFLVLITGGLHEDGLADVADGFGGGGSNRDKVLAIMKDSRVGSFGVIALVLSLLARFALLQALPASQAAATLIAAHVLCRWTALPLAKYLPSARGSTGQSARLALHLPRYAVPVGTALAVALVVGLMGRKALLPLLAAVVVTALSALYYRRRLGGVTGDCLGATNQLTEIAIYACAVLGSAAVS